MTLEVGLSFHLWITDPDALMKLGLPVLTQDRGVLSHLTAQRLLLLPKLWEVQVQNLPLR